MIRVLIVDDHPIVRNGMRQIISDTSDILIADEAATCQEALEKVRKMHFDVVVLDISMPGRGGMELLKQLRQEKPKLPVLMLTIHSEEQYAVRAIRTGASGYLTKESAPEELIMAIRKVAGGGHYISSSLAETLAHTIRADAQKPPHQQLSDREYEVFQLLAKGKRVSDIARELSLSVKTISTYRSRIMLKMNMKSNAELIFYAIRNRLVLF